MSPPVKRWRTLLSAWRSRWRISFRYVGLCLQLSHIADWFLWCCWAPVIFLAGLPAAAVQRDLHGQPAGPEESHEWDRMAGTAAHTHTLTQKLLKLKYKYLPFLIHVLFLQSFESWMRFWLIFQMAQQKPAPPTPDPGDCSLLHISAHALIHTVDTFISCVFSKGFNDHGCNLYFFKLHL